MSWGRWNLVRDRGEMCIWNCGALWGEAGQTVTWGRTEDPSSLGKRAAGGRERDVYWSVGQTADEPSISKWSLALSQWLWRREETPSSSSSFSSSSVLLFAWPALPRHHIFAVTQLCCRLRRFQELTWEPRHHLVSQEKCKFPNDGIKVPNDGVKRQFWKSPPSKIRNYFIIKQDIEREPRNPTSILMALGFF